MGLCKCPKKKVTNLFCFEHRVNVCENCLVANHSKCVIKSYLQWLQDSDYNPNCSLCHNTLNDNQYGDCIRLTCYDIFHWPCLNQYAQQFPANTAPAGYTCPTCNAGIFPPQNMVSPVADKLKSLLSTVNWARAGLGLPLIDGPQEPSLPPPQASPLVSQSNESSTIKSEANLVTQNTPQKHAHQGTTPFSPTGTSSLPAASPYPLGASPTPQTGTPYSPMLPPNYNRPSAHVSPNQHSVISVDEGTSVRGQEKLAFGDPRKLFDSTKEDSNSIFNTSQDHDENKYKRRSAMEWFSKWLKSRESKYGKKDPMSIRKRFLVVLVIGIIGFLTIVVIFSKLGRSDIDDDPFLGNPQVRVMDEIID
ncbi:zinc finger protein-like 1 homolog [Crassostrea virginica]|uniref:Zinc finger protein-like 1 n=1 Tax=Crassostrea virginica TaxID=6565 RepID=A0A8B8E2N9_CRAVI|nr:zinc finger protein-like 1 [Crassostrea virginica]